MLFRSSAVRATFLPYMSNTRMVRIGVSVAMHRMSTTGFGYTTVPAADVSSRPVPTDVKTTSIVMGSEMANL